MDSTTKVCTKCGECKALADFSPRKAGILGAASACKKCKQTQGRQARALNPSLFNARTQAWRAGIRQSLNSTRRRQYAEGGRDRYVERVSMLENGYVAARLKLPVVECPSELIELKREQLTVFRLSKQLRSQLKGESK